MRRGAGEAESAHGERCGHDAVECEMECAGERRRAGHWIRISVPAVWCDDVRESQLYRHRDIDDHLGVVVEYDVRGADACRERRWVGALVGMGKRQDLYPGVPTRSGEHADRKR